MRFISALILALFACLACVEMSAGARDISQEEFISNPPASSILLDVRSRDEFNAGHVPKAMNIPHDELAARLDELGVEQDAPVVVYCKSGVRAAKATQVLEEAGYTHLLHLAGDMNAWRANGRPIEMP